MHDITVCLFLDTEVESHRTPAPKKRSSDHHHSSASTVEAASARTATEVSAWAPTGEGVTASATPSTHPAAAGPPGGSFPGERTVDTPLAAQNAVPVLSLRCGNTLTPTRDTGFWNSDDTIPPCGNRGGSALCRGGMVRTTGGLPAKSSLFDHLPLCG